MTEMELLDRHRNIGYYWKESNRKNQNQTFG